MTVLLTGASGFLGRHVLTELADYPLRLLALPDDPSLSELQEHGQVVIGDVTRAESLPSALEGVTQADERLTGEHLLPVVYLHGVSP